MTIAYGLILSIFRLEDAEKCYEYKIPWIYYYPISSYYELNVIVKLNPVGIKLAAPLFFDLENVKTQVGKIEISAEPHIATQKSFEKDLGVIGTWIRPEDILMYQSFISTYDFSKCNTKKTKALYDIYIKHQKWNGNINLIIDGLNENVDNRIIAADLIQKRLGCRQECLRNGICKKCYRHFAKYQIIQKHFREKTWGKE